ncbi:hypothetical protein E1295_12900 [Nonomuraea mesophila]|uniref:Uncharacterized protein n=1 Tax=Nonomuraea mesophila TaxID=2530382 RepID=A0A4R5FSV0_9ACTN|nr:hypothetical protein [Nonomuraea mesophila]TDE55836.1 hypothetical protein E1295_12900 [Nonomuraea mesophila]
MADYPARNPFPARGTSSAEETSLPDFLTDWAHSTPTALLPAVRGGVRQARTYLASFDDDGALHCLYGAHGIGKTHAARSMMAFVNEESPDAVQLYLRFQDDDFVAAYRRLVSQLPLSLLTELSLSYLDTLAEELSGREGRPVGGESQASGPFRPDPVESGEVLEEQAKEIAAVAGDWPQFQRALSYLMRPGFADDAYDWLCGRPISPESSRALGVSAQIDDPLTCRYGMQLLTRLVTGGGRPFVMVLDQCEKFLLDDGDPVPRNIGILQGLVETVPRARGMLVLVASEAGWECMPQDLRQRLGAGACHMLPLTPGEATLVLATYINAARQSDGDDIWPFTEAGVLELLRHSGGNIRLLLQLAWAGFEAAAPAGLIDARLVTTVSARHSSAPGFAALATLVERELRACGLAAERVEENGTITSFQLPGGPAPRAVIRLSEAVFFDDEVANADVMLTRRAGSSSAFTALLVTGYVSPTVLTVLREAMHVVLVADGSPAFDRALDELVKRLAAMPAVSDEPPPQDEALQELRTRLDELTSARQVEVLALQRRLDEVAERLERERRRRPDWRTRRAELVEHITEARDARAVADWLEFRRASAFAVRRRAKLLASLALAVVTAIALFAAAATAGTLPLQMGMVAGGAAVLGLAALLWRAPAARKVRHAVTGVESRRDLDRLAREAGTRAEPHSADPVGRYAYALREDPDDGYQRLVEAMLTEPLAIVRQAMGRRLAVSEHSPAECVPDVLRGLREGCPEMLLLLARRQRHAEAELPPRVLRDLPPELRVLVALANPGTLALADGAVSRQPAEFALEALGVRGPLHPLALAFRGGVSHVMPIEIPPSALRATAHLLSPLEHGGFGTYDWLPLIAEIDELFLFFEELLYYQEDNRINRYKS